MLLTMSVSTALADGGGKKKPVDIQILGLNDFHGQLEVVPPLLSSGGRIGPVTAGQCNPTPPITDPVTTPCVPAGGVEYLATHVEMLRKTNKHNTVFVSAGDLIGATPLLSAAFHDEPTIEAFNLMDLDYNGVGNHEFDEGVDELLRMQWGNRRQSGGGDDDDDDDDDRHGKSRNSHVYRPARRDGCHPVDGCGDGDKFRGAEFDFLAANVVYRDNGDTIFPPYAIHKFKGGAKVAFVGMTLEGTDLIVSPQGIVDIDFLDEAESVNALVPHLRRRGVEAIVVLLHEGGTPSNTGGHPDLINTCNNPGGALPPIVAAMDDEIDVVITGHTNWAVNCIIDGKVVTGAASQGRLITDIDAKIDPRKNEFVPGSIVVNNRIVTQNVKLDRDLTKLIAKYNAVIGPIANEIVGNLTAPMTRTANAAGESQLGRLIADAQLASSQGAGAQLAFMNPGGIRADLNVTGDITYGQIFAVQPFSNIVTTKTYTGAQIEQILEQQFRTSAGGNRTLVLAVSEGFSYTWDGSAAAAGNRVDPASMMLNGSPILPGSTYRVTMNSFLATGGDDFPAFNLGTDEVTGDDDLVALEAYLAVNNPYTPSLTPARITRLN
jgi:5'-nucleotidase